MVLAVTVIPVPVVTAPDPLRLMRMLPPVAMIDEFVGMDGLEPIELANILITLPAELKDTGPVGIRRPPVPVAKMFTPPNCAI